MFQQFYIGKVLLFVILIILIFIEEQLWNNYHNLDCWLISNSTIFLSFNSRKVQLENFMAKRDLPPQGTSWFPLSLYKKKKFMEK